VKVIPHILLIIALLLALCNAAFAGEEIQTTFGPRALGLAGAFVGCADDATAALWNPGGLGYLKGFEFQISPLEDSLSFSLAVKSYGNLAAYLVGLDEPDELEIGQRIDILGVSHSRDMQTGLSYGKKIGKYLSVGAGFGYRKLKSREMSDFGYNVGILVIPMKRLSFGIDTRYFADEYKDYSDEKPYYFREKTHLGLAIKPHRAFKIMGGVDGLASKAAVGAEIGCRGVFLRGGSSFQLDGELNARWTVGAGILIKNVAMDYAYLNEAVFGKHHVASLSIYFGKPSKPGIIMEKQRLPDMTVHILKGKALPRSEIPKGKVASTLRFPRALLPEDEPLVIPEALRIQKLTFNIAKTEAYPLESHTFIRHTVTKNDTLSEIAKKYRDRIFPRKYQDYNELAKYNGIKNPNVISTGQIIRIPTSERAGKPKGGYESVLSALKAALTTTPNDVDLLNTLAVLQIERNEIDQAMKTIKRAEELDASNAVVKNNLGLIHMLNDEYKPAEAALKKAIELQPKLASAHCNLGLLYLTQSKKNKAIGAFLKALEADKNCWDAIYNLKIARR